MSEKIEDGGCAFPTDNVNSVNSDGNRRSFSPGMSLRDWFAGNVAANQMQLNGHNINEHQAAATAKWAYMVADALLAERSKAEGSSHA